MDRKIEKIKQVKTTICLLNSMILGGEQHSETSTKMMNEALDNLQELLEDAR
jgi:hypothetical protein